jgi:hypothetical protein
VIQFSPNGAKTAGRKGDFGKIMCGLSAGPRPIHGEELDHRVSVNIATGSTIYLNHDRLGLGISTGESVVLAFVLPGLRDRQACPGMK